MMPAMARKPRVEIEGGLYHVITRGNNRQVIFNSRDDYLKMLALLEHQKRKLPFRLSAYCLMPNHIHLLIERREDSISRIMQRVLTGYSQYHNRRCNQRTANSGKEQGARGNWLRKAGQEDRRMTLRNETEDAHVTQV